MAGDRSARRDRGLRIARVLSGTWRAELPAAAPALDDLTAVLPQLLATGAGPLAWRRIRETPLAGERSLAELRNSYRLAALNVRVHEAELARVVGAVRSRGLRPLLVKGWAAARCYPDPALRPYGDLDLLFAPDEWPAANRILETLVSSYHPVEVHVAGEGAYRVLPPSDWTAALQRAETVELDGVEIEVPAAEDHFRILCAHLLAHGAWRPLWLCDLAAMLELHAGAWDWSRVFRGSGSTEQWLSICVHLASELLGAEAGGAPSELQRRPMPAWIAATVLLQWGEGTGGSRREVLSLPFLKQLASRGAWREELSGHWPNPIQASFELGAPVARTLPRGVQCAAAARRLPRLVRRLLGGAES